MSDGSGDERPHLLCISTYEKGQPFLREAARLGCTVTLLTVQKLQAADWPRDALFGFETMPEGLTPEATLPFVTRLAKHRLFRRVVALDEFDMETAALLREHLRLPGVGQTATRLFRDKLAMREGAARGGVRVPEFCRVVNHDEVYRFLHDTRGPWLLKPRASASAIGIQKIHALEEIWPLLEQLGDTASDYLLERFIPGNIYHVEGITWNGQVKFALAHKYAQPPMETMHQGGIFSTRTLPREGEEAIALRRIHEATLQALGMRCGVTHSEFIRAYEDGEFRFLESGARVGGAYIAEVVEFASGVNPWVEWARIEVAQMKEDQMKADQMKADPRGSEEDPPGSETYHLPPLHEEYAGSVISLARQNWPDTAAYTDPEVVYRLHKRHHAGLIVRSPQAERVEALLGQYSKRFLLDFYARLDAPDRPTS